MLLQTRVVIIRGLSQDTTQDAVWNYFENSRRSGGGAVEEVNIEGNLARVKFESSEGNLNTMFPYTVIWTFGQSLFWRQTVWVSHVLTLFIHNIII